MWFRDCEKTLSDEYSHSIRHASGPDISGQAENMSSLLFRETVEDWSAGPTRFDSTIVVFAVNTVTVAGELPSQMLPCRKPANCGNST